VSVPKISICAGRAREEASMTGPKIGRPAQIRTDDWLARHQRVSVYLTMERYEQMRKIADAAELKTPLVVAKLLSFALQELLCEKKRREFEKSIR
jgi:hypothetical protein